jgi:cytochrome P450
MPFSSMFRPYRGKLPPGPPAFQPWKSNFAVQHDLLFFLNTLIQTYGDTVRFQLAFWPAYLLNSPEDVKRVLQTNSHKYDKDVLFFRMLRPWLGNGLVTNLEPASWLRQRRLLQPAFHKSHIAAFDTIMTTETVEMLQRWDMDNEEGRPLPLLQEMQRLTLRIASRTLFGSDFSQYLDPFNQALIEVNEFFLSYLRFPFPPLSFPMPRHKRFWQAKRFMDSVIYEMIAHRRQTHEGRKDLLSLLLQAKDEETGEQMSQQQVHDEALTLLAAGYETTATVLTWLWCLLAQHPQVEERLHRELDDVLAGRLPTGADLPRLVYLRLILEETLRLYPSGWLEMRKAREADELGGYTVPKNTILIWSPYLLHRHPDFWEQPERFDPERANLPTSSRQQAREADTWIPFGNGPHRCIGQHFAMMEMTLLVATIAQRYRLLLAPGYRPEIEPFITLGARQGLPVLKQRR